MPSNRNEWTESLQASHRPCRRRGRQTIWDHAKTICAASGKIRYRDSAQAGDALDACRFQRRLDLSSSAQSARNETRIYRCDHPSCHRGFHITSIRDWKAVS